MRNIMKNSFTVRPRTHSHLVSVSGERAPLFVGVPPCPLSPASLLTSSFFTRRSSGYALNSACEMRIRRRARTTRAVADGSVPASAPASSSSATTSSVSSKASTGCSLNGLLSPADIRRFIFVGGKGGVGKTSTACAIAVKCADSGLRTLLISTDPAHSIGDALRIKLDSGLPERVPLDPPAAALFALEADPAAAVREFRELVAGLGRDASDDVGSPGKDKEGWGGVAQRLGIREFADVLDTIPPGADELLALLRVLDIAEELQVDRVVVDTAPTGHTLRLLSFPDFLDRFLAQALALRRKLNSARGMLSSMSKFFRVPKTSPEDVDKALEKAAARIEEYRARMSRLADLFRDPTRAEFVVVAIPTVLAVEETKRLVSKLWDEGIWVRYVVANQVVPKQDTRMVDAYLQRLRKGQAREIAFATEFLAEEYGLTVSTIPLFDTEVRGIYALRALATVAFGEARQPAYGDLFDPLATTEAETNAKKKSVAASKFAFVGGKGGVGKTSVSASLGVGLAQQGLKTLILSTDPAHSLADALDISLEGGAPVPVDATDGNLFAMEIDTAAAVADFQKLVGEFAADGRRGVGPDLARKLGLNEFAGMLDNAPPGIDELVALTQVVDLVEYGDFDRVVVDTAPTGHTLRLLNFPEFLDNFLGKLVRLKQRLDSAMETLRTVLGRKSTADVVDVAAEKVDRFRKNMTALSELIADEQRTQFVIVTVPTGLAMAESERLARSLRKDGVHSRNLIINQVVPDSSAAAFVGRIVSAQDGCLQDLESAGEDKGIIVIRMPSFDAEIRGVYGLRAMANVLFLETGPS